MKVAFDATFRPFHKCVTYNPSPIMKLSYNIAFLLYV